MQMRETLTVIRADCLAATTEWLPSKGKTAVRLNRLMGPAIGGWQAATQADSSALDRAPDQYPRSPRLTAEGRPGRRPRRAAKFVEQLEQSHPGRSWGRGSTR